MIVRNTDSGWEIIHQQAHGLLAFQITLQWATDKRPTHWFETITALLEHDDGQDDWVGTNHLTEAGAPLQFTIKEYSVEQCHRMIDIGLHKSRWNAYMLSRHATFLYEPKRGQNQALDVFLDQQKSNQAKWMKAYGVSQQEADYAYDLLQWCDALSLILCQGQLPPDERRLEISRGPDGLHYYIWQRKQEETLCVEPWPFASVQFSVHVEVYPLSQLRFASDKALYNAINDAPVEVREWTFKK